MKLFNFSFKELFFSKRFTTVISILLAFSIWMAVTIEQKPVTERTFTDVSVNVNLEGSNISKSNLKIITDISKQKFTVALRGQRSTLATLKASDIQLFASALEVKAAGDYELSVEVSKDNSFKDCEILSISPPTVKVNFDQIDKKEFNITANAEGAVVDGEGLFVEADIVEGLEGETVTIEGPRTEIQQIHTVSALAKVHKTLKKTEIFDASIVLYNEKGRTIKQDNIKIDVSKLKVQVSISKKKSIPVELTYSNLPTGFSKDSLNITLDHPNVTVFGAPSEVDKIEKLELSPIDMTMLSLENSTFKLTPKLPEGISISEGIFTFNATVDMTDYAEKTIKLSKSKLKGLESGLKVQSSTPPENVTICGPAWIVNNFSSKKLSATIDLSGRKAGTYSIVPTFTFDGITRVWVTGNVSTNVTIK